MGRSYCKLRELTYDGWIKGIRAGRSYVSDGKTHLMDFTVNGVAVGESGSEIALASGDAAHVEVMVAAYLDPTPDPAFWNLERKPFWDVELARVEGTREVPVEIIVNGEPTSFTVNQSVPWGPQEVGDQFYFVAGDPFDVDSDSNQWGLVPTSAVLATIPLE